jgi:hypothetical protein
MVCPSDKKFGGGQDNTMLNALLDGNISELYNDEVTTICNSCFAYRYNLATAILPNVSTIGASAFDGLSNLENVIVPNVTRIDGYAFRNTTKLEILDLAVITTLNGFLAFRGSAINTLILRSKNKCSLANSPFNDSLGIGGAGGGTVYVDYSNLTWYPTATGWKDVANTTFASIQENLATLYDLGVDITDYYTIVDELPTSDVSTDKVYFILDSGTTYHQWFYGSGSREQLADITL